MEEPPAAAAPASNLRRPNQATQTNGVMYYNYASTAVVNPDNISALMGSFVRVAARGNGAEELVLPNPDPADPGMMMLLRAYQADAFHLLMQSLLPPRSAGRSAEYAHELYEAYRRTPHSVSDDAFASVVALARDSTAQANASINPANVAEADSVVLAVRNSGAILVRRGLSVGRFDAVHRSTIVAMVNLMLRLSNSDCEIRTTKAFFETPVELRTGAPSILVSFTNPTLGGAPDRDLLSTVAPTGAFAFHLYYLPFGKPMLVVDTLKNIAMRKVYEKVSRQPMKIRGLPHDLASDMADFNEAESKKRLALMARRIGDPVAGVAHHHGAPAMDRKSFYSALVHTSPTPGTEEAAEQRRAVLEQLIGVPLISTERITESNVSEVDPRYYAIEGQVMMAFKGKSSAAGKTHLKEVDFDHPINDPLVRYRPGPSLGYGYRHRRHVPIIARPWYRPVFVRPPPIFLPPLLPPPPPLPQVIVAAPPPPPPVVAFSDPYAPPPGAVIYDPVEGLPVGWMQLSNGFRVPIGSDIRALRGVTVVRTNAPPKLIREELIAESPVRNIDEWPPYRQKLDERNRLLDEMKAIRQQFDALHGGAKP